MQPAFPTTQDMYNHAANQLIVHKLSQQDTKNDLINRGVSPAEADTVIQTLMVEIEKNKPAEANAKKAEGKRYILMGLAMAAIGGVITGATYEYGGGTYVVTYGLIAVGAWYFLKGLFKMF